MACGNLGHQFSGDACHFPMGHDLNFSFSFTPTILKILPKLIDLNMNLCLRKEFSWVFIVVTYTTALLDKLRQHSRVFKGSCHC